MLTKLVVVLTFAVVGLLGSQAQAVQCNVRAEDYSTVNAWVEVTCDSGYVATGAGAYCLYDDDLAGPIDAVLIGYGSGATRPNLAKAFCDSSFDSTVVLVNCCRFWDF